MKNSSSQLEIGYGRVNITPDYPVAMAGSAKKRISEGALDPLFITFLALRGEGATLLVATMDIVCTNEEFAEPVREEISGATGIPRERIVLNSTHTHSSVLIRNGAAEGIARYRKDFSAWAVEAAKAALADLAPAEVFYGNVKTQGMAWVRHYKMADGSYAGANYGSFQNSTIQGHASEADGELQLIRFARTDGKQDIILTSFPAHGTLNERSLLLSADFPGPARAYVEEKTGAPVAHFIGGAGDQVPTSRIEEENFSKDYRVYGEEIGRLAVEGLKHLKKAENASLRFTERFFEGRSNKAELDRAEDALAVEAVWNRVGGRGTKEGKEAAKARGFSSVYHVTAILNRMHFPETRSLELHVLSLGSVAMIFAPYEMFGANAMYVKEHSPFDMTFVASCSQNHAGYLPSTLGCQIGCYEAQITKLAHGTAEEVAKEFVDMLEEIKH